MDERGDDTSYAEEEETEGAAVLPAREAMSLIAPDDAPGFIPDLPPASEAGEAEDSAADGHDSES